MPTTPTVHVPVTKPFRYRLVGDPHPDVARRLARTWEASHGVDAWRKAAACWRAVRPTGTTLGGETDAKACLSIATTSEMSDAFRAYRAEGGRLSYRAFGHRWLLASDTLHEHFAFSDTDPVSDASRMQFVVEGMELTQREDELCDACCSVAGEVFRAYHRSTFDWPSLRRQTSAQTVVLLGLRGWTEKFVEESPELAFFVEVALYLQRNPQLSGATRERVELTGDEEVPA